MKPEPRRLLSTARLPAKQRALLESATDHSSAGYDVASGAAKFEAYLDLGKSISASSAPAATAAKLGLVGKLTVLIAPAVLSFTGYWAIQGVETSTAPPALISAQVSPGVQPVHAIQPNPQVHTELPTVNGPVQPADRPVIRAEVTTASEASTPAPQPQITQTSPVARPRSKRRAHRKSEQYARQTKAPQLRPEKNVPVVPAISRAPGAVPIPKALNPPKAPHPRAQKPLGDHRKLTQVQAANRQASHLPRAQSFNELKSIARARALLSSNPARALSLLIQTARQYPDGHFREERSALTVLALAKLGRPDQARARAQRFLSRYPQSPFVDQINLAVRGESHPRG